MKGFLFFAFVFFTSFIFSQEIPVERIKSYSYTINENSLIYDKETKSKIEFKDINELLEKYPYAEIEPKEEDVNGNPLSFYFIKGTNKDEIEAAVVEIKRNDIFGNTFNLNSINSKYTLIILQLDLEFPMINVESIKEAEDAAIKRGYVSVILTETDLAQSKNFAREQGFKSVIIPNARNLFHKFNSKRFPLYVILDSNKSILSSLKYSYEVEDKLKAID